MCVCVRERERASEQASELERERERERERDTMCVSVCVYVCIVCHGVGNVTSKNFIEHFQRGLGLRV